MYVLSLGHNVIKLITIQTPRVARALMIIISSDRNRGEAVRSWVLGHSISLMTEVASISPCFGAKTHNSLYHSTYLLQYKAKSTISTSL